MLKRIVKHRGKVLIIIFLLILIIYNSQKFIDPYFSISFVNVLTILSNIVLAVFVALYIGQKINKNSRILDLKLEGINKFEKKIEETCSKFDSYLMNQQDLNYTNIKILFRDASEITSILTGIDLPVKERTAILNVEDRFADYWELLLNPLSNSNFNGFTLEQQAGIYNSRHELMKNIYRYKVTLYS